jgi:hypothetical protein
MAVGVLTNDRERYRKAVNLYHATVKDYTKFGRAKGFRDGGRALGETSETLRDIYHTQVEGPYQYAVMTCLEERVATSRDLCMHMRNLKLQTCVSASMPCCVRTCVVSHMADHALLLLC